MKILLLYLIVIACTLVTTINKTYAGQVSNVYPRTSSATSSAMAEVGVDNLSSCPINSTTNPNNLSAYNAAANGSNCFMLYNQSGGYIHSSSDPTAATRREGFYAPYSEFEVASSASVLSNTGYQRIKITHACSILTDSTGVEDHGYRPGSNTGNDIYVDVEAIAQTGYGSTGNRLPIRSTTSSNNVQTLNCNQADVNGDLTFDVPPTDFVSNPRYGSNVESIIVSVNKSVAGNSGAGPGLDGKKAFGIVVPQGFYVSYANITPYPNYSNGGGTYSPGVPSGGNSFNSLNIEDPGADYNYNAAQNDGYNYGSVNVPANSTTSDFTFEFKPDCSYTQASASGNNQIYLKWTRGSPGGPPNGPQISKDYWELYDLNTRQDVNLNGANTSNYNDTVGYNSNNYFYYPARGSGGYDSSNGITLPSATDTYQWIWHNIDRAHGLTVWMPFSEITTAPGNLYDTNSCPKPNSQCSWIGAADVNSTRVGSNYPNSGGGSGGSYSASTNSVWISMNFYNNGGLTWQKNSYGIHFLAPGGGGSTNSLFNDVLVNGSYTIYGSNHTSTLQFNQPANATATSYDFQMTDANGNPFGAKCKIAIIWPPGPNRVIVQGHVYNLDPNGTNEDIPGVTVDDCNGQTTTTLSNGYFYFREKQGAHFGLYIGQCNNTAAPPTGSNGPFIRPWTNGGANEGYFGCGPFSGNYTSPTPNYCDVNTSFMAMQSYDWQWAGTYIPPGTNKDCTTGAQTNSNPPTGCDSIDRNWDWGYDFVYTPQAPHGLVASDCVNGIGGGVVNPPYQGTPLQIWMSSQTASSSGSFSGSPSSAASYSWTDNNGNFNIPASSYLDGYRHRFFVNANGLDMFGQPDGLTVAGFGLGGNGPGGYGTEMLACAPFDTSGSTAVTLSPSNQAPTSYSTSSTATVTYNSGTNPSFNPNFGMSCNVTLSPNPVPNPPPYVCSSGGFYSGNKPDPNTNTTPIYGPNGSISSVNYGDSYCPTLTLGYTKALVQEDGTIRSDYGQGPNVITGGCQDVQNEPYVQFYGNDVTAGAGFNAAGGGACTQYTRGTIDTFNNGSASYTGSGGQFGAFALGSISQFVSAIQRGFPPAPPTGLTFANTAGSGGYGGNFGKSGADYCVENYYDKKPTSTTNLASATLGSGSAVESTTGQHAYSHVGTDLTINGLNIANGVNSAVYVDGNVYITGNITYSGAAGAWAGINDIPSLFIVTSPGHNIYIEPGVTQLDGVYVAEPDANNQNNNGVIDTCNDGTFNFKNAPNDSLKNTCGSQLVVNGSFVAQQINLHRTLSSLRYAQAGESLNSSPRDCGGGIFYADCAAEVFNFSPELYLSLPGITPAGGPSRQTFDAYDSLSPIL